jgi:hypothetical protein
MCMYTCVCVGWGGIELTMEDLLGAYHIHAHTYLEHRQGLGPHGGAEGVAHVIGAGAPPEPKRPQGAQHCLLS